jgi:hypothetical protein
MEFRNARIIERVQRRLRRKNETHNDDVCGVGSTYVRGAGLRHLRDALKSMAENST